MIQLQVPGFQSPWTMSWAQGVLKVPTKIRDLYDTKAGHAQQDLPSYTLVASGT